MDYLTMHGLSVLGALGLTLSSYAIYVKKQKMTLQEEYVALCDLDAFSCSQVLASEYSSLLSYWGLVETNAMLDVSNAHLGVLFYSLFVLYPVMRKVPYHAHFYTMMSCCAMAVMLYLAYILAFVLRDFCLVCVATYVITAELLWNSVVLLRAERRALRSAKHRKTD